MADRSPVPGTASGSPVGVSDSDPGERGTLVIKDRAVQRIAEAAALSVTGVVPSAQSTNSVNAALGRAYPRVDCEIAGDRVRAEVAVVGRWPVSAPHLGAQVRQTVTDQLQTLAGLRVDAVDVTIARIVRVAAPVRRRVQ
ncbi:Asp23/Gls24 family envelope stress response protein [Actinoplanes sp. NPDC051494]|uniref:Asp23/Gls24 family envelope stress response protein n=1 Tax=Actinoplanes sp. NPDC051494 TaxID=3363907 RepID=UPI0037ABA517